MEIVPAAIEQNVRRSEVTVVMWSRGYAQSAWCDAEPSLALSLEAFDMIMMKGLVL